MDSCHDLHLRASDVVIGAKIQNNRKAKQEWNESMTHSRKFGVRLIYYLIRILEFNTILPYRVLLMFRIIKWVTFCIQYIKCFSCQCFLTSWDGKYLLWSDKTLVIKCHFSVIYFKKPDCFWTQEQPSSWRISLSHLDFGSDVTESNACSVCASQTCLRGTSVRMGPHARDQLNEKEADMENALLSRVTSFSKW